MAHSADLMLPSSLRWSLILDIKIVGKFAELVACSKFDVIYSSSWSGNKTQASWKKGLLVAPAVEKRRACDGVSPISEANAE